MSKPQNVTHTDIESFAASNPMDCHPLDRQLLTIVDGVEVSAMPLDIDCRGLSITIELERAEICQLAFDRPVAIRNAIYAIVGAMGEPMRLRGVADYSYTFPPSFEFEAERQWDDEDGEDDEE